MRYSYFALFKVLEDAQSRILLAGGVLLAAAGGAPLPIIGVIFSKIINHFPPSEAEIQRRVYQLLAVAIAYFVITWGWALCWGIIGARVSRRLRSMMVHRALSLDQAFYETECPDITSRLTQDAQTVQTGTAEKVGLFIQSVSYFIVSFLVGFILNARLTGILFAAVIPAMIICIYSGTYVINRLSQAAAESTTEASRIAEAALKGIQAVQAFEAFEVLTREHELHLLKAMRFGVKKAVAGALLLSSIFFIAYSANALAFWQGAKMASSGGGAGTVYAIVFLILDASFVIGQAGPFIQTFSAAASAGSRIRNLIDHPTRPIDVYSQHGIRADERTLDRGKRICFQDITFMYPARPLEIVLHSVSFSIETGTTVGVVGASGSGKSTVAALLLRFYDPVHGTICIDGHTIPEYHLASLRKQMAYVDQNPTMFSGTIYHNLRNGYRGHDLSDDELRGLCIKAAKAADAWSFIELLPQGIDTWVGEQSGTNLSGGQKQRLCLARALVGDPPLLILDEPTSALDTITEASILASISRLRSQSNRTTVIIAHRLASVRDADNIIVMGNGQILEQGNHDILASHDEGAYRQLIEAQKLISYDQSDCTIIDEKTVTIEELSPKEKITPVEIPGPTITPPVATQFGIISILYRCLVICRSRMILTCLALLGSLTTGALILGESIIFGHLVILLNNSVPEDEVSFWCLMFFVIALAALIGYVTSGSCFGVVSEYLIMRTRDISLRNVLRQDMEWFSQPGTSTSALISVINMDSGHLSGLSGVIIGTIVSALVSVVGGGILAHIVAWKIAIVLFATSPIIIFSGYFRLRVLAKLEEKSQQAYIKAAALATEACSSLTTIAALGIEKETSRQFDVAMSLRQKQTLHDLTLGNLILAFALAIPYFVYALAYWWGSRLVRTGQYSSLQFFIVLPAILFSAQAAGQIFSVAPDIGRAKGAASRVFTLHDQQPTIDTGTAGPPKAYADPPIKSQRGTLEFRNVTFAYKSRTGSTILNDLSFTIKAGETVALVGRSGAGKSSLISLIARFYDPTAGSIFLDGVDIKSLAVSQHRAQLSLVAQEPDLFSGSVAFNVGLGARPGHSASREEIIAACKAVGIHDFINGLPDGYETQCGSDGSQLSGGQKQRIAIARAYIRDAEILLLDEATSALDSHSESQIQQAIANASRKRTTIMIAHRLASVQHADRILVFDHGRVVEVGRHQDLIHSGGIYQQMVAAQDLG